MYGRHGYGSHPGARRDNKKEERVKKITKSQITKKERYRAGGKRDEDDSMS